MDRFIHADADDTLSIMPTTGRGTPVVATGDTWLAWRRLAIEMTATLAEKRREAETKAGHRGVSADQFS